MNGAACFARQGPAVLKQVLIMHQRRLRTQRQHIQRQHIHQPAAIPRKRQAIALRRHIHSLLIRPITQPILMRPRTPQAAW